MHNRIKHLAIAATLFLIEILVATRFSNMRFVRGSLGDFLVVILLYHLVKVFFEIPRFKLASLVFVFACGIELSQYFHLADVLEFRSGGVINILMGNSFSWVDILMYCLGCMMAYFTDRRITSIAIWGHA